MATKAQAWKGEADNLDFDALEERIAYLTEIRDAKLAERRNEAVGRIKEIMAENDLSIEDFSARTGTKRGTPSGRKMTPKYRDPSDSQNVWTGQGRAPKWMPENKEQWTDFLIKPA